MILRVILGMLVVYFVIEAVKNFPLVVVSIVMNTSALLITLFAFLLLGETMKKAQLLFLCLAFIGVYVLVTARKNNALVEDAGDDIKDEETT
jgi:drug/metabolite transporter (DMT)-like permease